MSATLEQQGLLDNRKLFPSRPRVLELSRKMFPVAVHMEPLSVDDYVEAAARKVVEIHTKSGTGGILVFLTGQREINDCIKRINELLSGEPEK